MKPKKELFLESFVPDQNIFFIDGRSSLFGMELKLSLNTRPGRMGARAFAYAYRAEAVDEEEGMRVFNEIMKIVGEHEK